MSLKLAFYGAAGNVTGSCYLLDDGKRRVLVDCGMVQERDYRERNWKPFPFDAATVDAVLLTHAHLDHCGLLPKLVNEGFKGRIYCTEATRDIAAIVMADAGKIQEEDAAFKRKRHEREGRKGPHPVVPLYTKEDAGRAAGFLHPVELRDPVEVAPGVAARFQLSGHILGATSIRIEMGGKSVLFSGDIGRWNAPIIQDPELADEADYVVIESTYGDRKHEPAEDIPERLEKIIKETLDAGGNLVIPSFAVERSQDLLYYLSGLRKEKRIPPIVVFVDSPMAVKVTDVFRRHPDLFDDESRALLDAGRHPCDFPGLSLVQSVQQSKSINRIRATAIIIAGSGMCTGGRIKHHLKSNASRPESTILFIGYQAVGTLGRVILGKPKEIRLFGEMQPLQARVEQMGGFSGHGDRDDLLRWIGGLKTKPQKVFVTHGEPEAAKALAEALSRQGFSPEVPAYLDTHEL